MPEYGPVTVERDGDVAVVTMNNPPVNALGLALRQGLMAALDSLRGDASVKAIVLAGTARAFSGGADITEFGGAMQDPNLRQVISAIEDMPVPVVAAMQGVALGGGLELALGCHARVAWPTAKMGLPEVKLGLLPGAGGTQRLPRVAGVEKALSMIVTGTPIGAADAQAAGVVDLVTDGPYPGAAVAYARTVTDRRRVRDREDKLEPARTDPGLIDRIAAPLLKASGAQAPRACVESVRAAVQMPFDEGAANERRLFEGLVVGDESRAQRHAFFAEREAQKAKLPPGTEPRPVQRAAVIGAGTMGGGIAMCFANAGIPVTVIETEQAALDRGMARIAELYATSAKRGSITQQQADERRGRIQGQLGLEGVRDADIVVEAVFEEMGIKKQVFAELDRLAKPGAVLATNTSYLDIDEIAAATSRPGDVLGMHFFSPANVMRLLEVVRGDATAPDVLATVMKLAAAIGKVPVVSGVCYGFIGNRMAEVYMREAEFLIMEGAEPAQVDQAVEALGFAMGPCRMLDMAGVDVGAKTVIEYGKSGGLPPDPSYRALVQRLFALGRFGQKTGAGYYRYEGRSAISDPALTAIAAELAEQHGILRRAAISSEEIVERLLYPLFNEGLKIVQEGIAYRPGDVDVVWVAGYGFPDFRGGPMWMAENMGLSVIAKRLRHYAQTRGDAYGYWTPSTALIHL